MESNFILLFFIFISLVGWLFSKIKFFDGRKRKLFGIGLLFGLVLIYVINWLIFFRIGIFLNIVTIKMLLYEPLQLLRFVSRLDPKAMLLIPLLSLGLTLLIECTTRFVRNQSILFIKTFIVVSTMGIILNTLFILAGHLYAYTSKQIVSDELNIPYMFKEYYLTVAFRKAGPFLNYKADLANYLDRKKINVDHGEFSIVRRPIISMEEYIKKVDLQRFSKFNVIILLIESMKKDVIPAYDGKRLVMPTVQNIAEQSLVFIHAYSQSSHSNYSDICPLSSHYPLRSRDLHFYPKNPVYPRVLFYDILKPLGYQTAIFSSQNEKWGGMINYLRTENLDKLFHSESLTDVKKITPPPGINEENDYTRWMLRYSKIAGKLEDSITIDHAIEWIQRREKGLPFAMYINLQNTHYPYFVPRHFSRKFVQRYPEEVVKRLREGAVAGLPLPVMYDQYCDSLAYIDTQIQRLVECLKEKKVWEKTILVITADTSTIFSPYGKLGFIIGNGGMLMNEVVNVPLIIYAPNITAKIDSRYVQHVDIPPTVIDLLGLPQHPSFQGISLVAKDYPKSRAVYMVAQAPFAHQYAIIKDNWMLRYDKKKEKYILIDLTASKNGPIRGHDQDLGTKLKKQLHAWINLQLDYYESTYDLSKYYPPVILDK